MLQSALNGRYFQHHVPHRRLPQLEPGDAVPPLAWNAKSVPRTDDARQGGASGRGAVPTAVLQSGGAVPLSLCANLRGGWVVKEGKRRPGGGTEGQLFATCC